MDKLDTLPAGRFGVRPNRLSEIIDQMRREVSYIRKDEHKYPELQHRTSATTLEEWIEILERGA